IGSISWADLAQVIMKSHTRLDGFILGSDARPEYIFGVYVEGSSDNIVIQNNTIAGLYGQSTVAPDWENCAQRRNVGGNVIAICVGSGCSNVDISDNVVSSLGGGSAPTFHSNFEACDGGYAYGIYVRSGVDTCTITGNSLSNLRGGNGGDHVCSSCGNPGDGGDAWGIWIEGGQNVLVAGNTVSAGFGGDGGHGWSTAGGDTYSTPGDFKGISFTGSGNADDNVIVDGSGGFPSGDSIGLELDGDASAGSNTVKDLFGSDGWGSLTGGMAAGITISGLPVSPPVVQHNVIHNMNGGPPGDPGLHGGDARGIIAQAPSRLFNNLLFDITGGEQKEISDENAIGILAAGADIEVINNTVARVSMSAVSPSWSLAKGIDVTVDCAPCTVQNNIVADVTGIQEGIDGGGFGFDAEAEPTHSHNLSFGASHADYAIQFLQGATDIAEDPLFVTLDSRFALEFFLSQTGCGQSSDSPAFDSGSDPASALLLDNRTTCTLLNLDDGTVDRGFHYPQDLEFGLPAIRRGDTLPGPLPVLIDSTMLPFTDPDPVFTNTYPPLLFYQVDAQVVIRLTKVEDASEFYVRLN
ncbi:hypothetical protein ACFLU6_15235, partial [Acidobacteriota bacterium]